MSKSSNTSGDTLRDGSFAAVRKLIERDPDKFFVYLRDVAESDGIILEITRRKRELFAHVGRARPLRELLRGANKRDLARKLLAAAAAKQLQKMAESGVSS